MKVSVWIEDSTTQLVLTPESEFEKRIVGEVEKGKQQIEIYTGPFYDCQGGWMRQGPNAEVNSLIMVMKVKPEKDT